jgi:hypothetical protein
VINIATNSQNKDKKITAFEKELIETVKQISVYKLSCEANIVSILYKNPSLMLEANLKLDEFSTNVWRVYFTIADDLVFKENKTVLDEITVGLYLEKHLKLKAKYDEYGGYETIVNAGSYVKTENFEGYIKELRKWIAVIKLAKRGFPVNDRLSEFCDQSAEDIYDEYTAFLNDSFLNIENDIVSYDISDGLDELIEELDKGMAVGLPYHNMKIITKETGGQYLGSITLVGGLSNVGKSTFARTVTIPSVLKYKEPIVIMINEDGKQKWQRELIVWVINNIFKEDLQKHIVRDGKFTPEIKALLFRAKDWIKEQSENHIITIIPFEKYKTSNAIKVIKKYASMHVKYFILDTFKLDTGKVSEFAWLQMQQAMVDINDVVKPEVKNLHILITFQLAKGNAKQRFYTQESIGISKNIVDTASTCLMIRDLYDDEYTGDKRELHVYRLEGKNGASKIPVKLDKEKHYQVVFVIKNREGAANQYQIVIEHDMSRNIMKEIGITHVPVDF